MNANTITNTNEKSKMERYSITSIIKQMDNKKIRFDHPSQRESEQWSSKMKGNLISDILQQNPIPDIVLAEQVINGFSVIWDLDGKQRCTTVSTFAKNCFKIPKTIRRKEIRYQSAQKDKDGNIIVDDKGFPVMEWKEFNIAGKYFKNLPEELQDVFMDYCFGAVLYLNCSSEDIVYHIARYNDGRPMNKTQKGIINLGEEYAAEVKQISNHGFFKDCGEYGKNGRINGNIDRVICETIIASNYIDNWKGNQEDICAFIRENATGDDFENVVDTLDRLEDIVDGTNESLFTNKESFIWFSVFNKFKTMDRDDDDFGKFMTEFVKELHKKKIGENTYDELEGRKSTKDKSLVINKINHLERLLRSFLGIVDDTAA